MRVSTSETEQTFRPYLTNQIFMKNTHAIETDGSGRAFSVISEFGPTGRWLVGGSGMLEEWHHGRVFSFCGHMIIKLTKEVYEMAFLFNISIISTRYQ